jgi:hypothetical protein
MDIIPSILCSDQRLSITLSVPSPINKQNQTLRVEDIFIQLEYAYYSKKNICFSEQATIVGSANFPTGSNKKILNLGLLVFFGFNLDRTYVDWFYFAATGPSSQPPVRNKVRDQFLYQAGIGRNICGSPC